MGIEMRGYQHIECYLNELMGDIYGQPPDVGHQGALEEICRKWLPHLHGLDSILDVGCGQGQAIPVLSEYAEHVVGVTLGDDARICQEADLLVYRADMSFLPFERDEFTLIFARHTLEHSPAPLLTLMEWHRVSQQWLLLVTPNYDLFGPKGQNHYYVLLPDQWEGLLERAGWHVIWRDETSEMEHRWLCERVTRRKGEPDGIELDGD